MGTEEGRVYIARPDSIISDYVLFFCTDGRGHTLYYARHAPAFWDDRNAIGRWLRTKVFPDYNSALYSITYYEEHCKEIQGDIEASWFAVFEEPDMYGTEYGCPACGNSALEAEGCIACVP